MERGAAGISNSCFIFFGPSYGGHLRGLTFFPSPHWEKASVSGASTENPCLEAWGEHVVLTWRPSALEVNTLTGWSLKKNKKRGTVRDNTSSWSTCRGYTTEVFIACQRSKQTCMVRDTGRPAQGLHCLSQPPMDLWLWVTKCIGSPEALWHLNLRAVIPAGSE